MRNAGRSSQGVGTGLWDVEAASLSLPARGTDAAFTVKLPEGLIHQLRRRAALREQSLSQLVTQALEVFLRKDRGRGS